MNYYRCQKGTEAYRILTGITHNMDLFMDAARELATELGAVAFSMPPTMVGGIQELCFGVKPNPKAYRIVRQRRKGGTKEYLCVPNTKTEQGKEIADKISELPFMYYGDICSQMGIQDKVIDCNKNMGLHPVEDWLYMFSDLEHKLDGLESITQKNYEDAQAYFKDSK